MNKKIIALFLLLTLMILGSSLSVHAVPIGTRGHYIEESIGDPETVDPAWAYDTSSGLLIANVYETLIKFDREKTSTFLPSISTQVPSYANGLIQDINETAPHGLFNWTQRITFPIRANVPFQSNSLDFVTPADVEFSFERWMVQDRAGGPEWMIYEPIEGIGYFHAFQLTGDPVLQGQVIDQAFQTSGNNFIMNLRERYPPLLGIIAQFWASIVNKNFISQYDWDGNWATWTAYHEPGEAAVDAAGHKTDGTGAYKLDYWTVGVEYSLVRHEAYWKGWDVTALSSETSGHLDRFTEKVVYEWGTRLADFRAGTCDVAYVPRQYKSQVEGWPGIRGMKDLPSLSADAMFFNFAIDPASPYVGDGSLAGGNGIPLDFFSDIHVRKGFAYVFNYTKFLDEVWLGEAIQPTSPVIDGITYANPANPVYYMDIAKAIAEFTAASNDASSPAYQVMTSGFYFKMTYNTGNQPRQTTAEMIKTNIKLVNPLFNIETTGVTWSTYLGEMWWYPSSRSVMPMYHIGWVADYPDAHNWVFPFMHTYGDFSYPSSYSNSTVDALIEEGIRQEDVTPAGKIARKAIYDKLQLMYYQDAPNVMIDQALARRWEREWVQGYFYNAIGTADFYTRWEGLNGDIAGDNDVDAGDWALIIAQYWWDLPDIGLYAKYNPRGDVGPELQYVEAKLPAPGTSVGVIDSLDLAVLNAHWGEIPT